MTLHTIQALARLAREQLLSEGGHTLCPRTNRLVEPADAWAVSRPGHDHCFSHLPTVGNIVDYIESHQSELVGENAAYLGGWYNQVNQTYYLGLTDLIADWQAAEALGRVRGQLAIYHLATQTEVWLAEETAPALASQDAA